MQRQTDTHKETKGKCLNAKDKTAYILEAIKVKINEVKWNIDRKLGCNTYNIVYGKICKKKISARKSTQEKPSAC